LLKVDFSRVNCTYPLRQIRQNNVAKPQLKPNNVDTVSFKGGVKLENLDELWKSREVLVEYFSRIKILISHIQRHADNQVNGKGPINFSGYRIPADGSIGLLIAPKETDAPLSLITPLGLIDVIHHQPNIEISLVTQALTDSLKLEHFADVKTPRKFDGKIYSVRRFFDHPLPPINPEMRELFEKNHTQALSFRDLPKFEDLVRAVYQQKRDY